MSSSSSTDRNTSTAIIEHPNSDNSTDSYATSLSQDEFYENSSLTEQVIEDIDLSDDNEEPKSILGSLLPYEVLVIIFGHLGIRSLDSVGLVCKKWYNASNDEQVWRSAFLNEFDTVGNFTRLTEDTTWKSEFIERKNSLRLWKKGADHRTVSLKSANSNVIAMAVNFQEQIFLGFSATSVHGLVVDLEQSVLHWNTISPLASYEGVARLSVTPNLSKYGILFCFENGRVASVSVSQKGNVRDYKRFVSQHASPIKASWVTNSQDPKVYTNSISAVTGDIEGNIMGWNFSTGALLFQFTIPIPSGDEFFDYLQRSALVYNSRMPYQPTLETFYGLPREPFAITYLNCDGKDMVIVCDNSGRLFVHSVSANSTTFMGALMDIVTDSVIDVDFGGRFVFVSHEDVIARYEIPCQGETKISTPVIFTNGSPGVELIQCVLDNSRYANEVLPENSNVNKVAGSCSRFIAAFNQEQEVFVWNSREKAKLDENGNPLPIYPIHKFDGIFRKSISIMTIAINSLVVAVGSVQGMVNVYDVITGKKLRTATPKFSKNQVNFSNPYYYRIILDDDATKCRGVVAVNTTVHYFNYHSAPNSKPKMLRRGRKVKASKNLYDIPKKTNSVIKQIQPQLSSVLSIDNRSEFQQELEDEAEIAKEVKQRQDQHESLKIYGVPNRHIQSHFTDFVVDEMTEEEQIRYAMLLSEEATASNENKSTLVADNDYGDDDYEYDPKDFESSDLPSGSGTSSGSYRNTDSTRNETSYEDLDEIDEELERVLKLSLVDQ